MEKIQTWWEGLATWQQSLIQILVPVLLLIYILWISGTPL